jgi:isopenicillin N synthase-like dioxygenase
MTLRYVPIIDLAPYHQGGLEGRRRVARQVDQACRDIGFLVITNHGVPLNLCREMDRVSRAFFDLPVEEKSAVAQWGEDIPRGYSGLEDESLSYLAGREAPGDLKESFTIGPIDIPEDDPYYAPEQSGQLFARNVWPERPPEFRKVWKAYYSAVNELANDMLRLFALALDLDEDYFMPMVSRHTSALRVLNYPEQKVPPKPGQLRAGEHTDYDTFTLLRQSEGYLSGLQALNTDKEWVDVPYVPDSFIVNIGDTMMQWTNDRWVSTLHRVLNPPFGTGQPTRRQSIVFFHQPNYDAVIECLATCRSHQKPAKYPPVRFADYLRKKFTSQVTFQDAGAAGF